MSAVAALFFSTVLLPVAVWTAWLWFLALRSLFPRPIPPLPDELPHIAIIIPAHDEEAIISETVRKILAFSYPENSFSVLVVADNCTDNTALKAQEAGAACLARLDLENMGKGHALAFGLRAVCDEPYDAVLFFDADSSPEPDYLLRMAACLARDKTVIQGRYDVDQPDRNWFTRLTAVSFTLRNRWIFPALDALGIAIPLRGSGMCFPAAIIRRLGWESHGLTEDAEMTLRLLREGILVTFAPGAVSRQYMPPSPGCAASQRLRWSAGESGLRSRIIKAELPLAVREKSWRAATAMLLLVAPAFSVQLCGVACLTLFTWLAETGVFAISLAVLAAYALYFLIGLGKPDRLMIAAVCMLPVFALWRTAIAFRACLSKPVGWIRTPRN